MRKAPTAWVLLQAQGNGQAYKSQLHLVTLWTPLQQQQEQQEQQQQQHPPQQWRGLMCWH